MSENDIEKEIPIGFLFKMATNSKALNYYSSLDSNTKQEITNYIQSSASGNEVKQKITKAIEHLKNNNIDFL